MKTDVRELSLLRPRTLPEALAMLRNEGPVTPIAGCTDVFVYLNFGMLAEKRFIDVWGLPGLTQIVDRGDVLSIGAAVTYRDILASSVVAARWPILQAAAREVGGRQIQARGTLGGNVANASPAGDTLPVLAVADAMIVLNSVGRERRVRLCDYYTGYRASVRRDDELITAIELPSVVGDQWFRKVGTRAAQAISKVVMAAVRGAEPRVALGSVAATVVRLPRTEAVLRTGDIDEAARTLEREIQPIDDIRSTANYRRRVASNLLRRCWGEARSGRMT